MPATLSITTHHPGNFIMGAARTTSGIVQVSGLASGLTTIIARSEGLAPAAWNLSVNSGSHHGPLALTLKAAATVHGRVLDASGATRSGARVIVGYGPDVVLSKTMANFLTRRWRPGQEGGFEIRNIIPGATLQLYAEHEGRRSPVTSMILDPGEERSGITVTLD